MRNFEPSTDPSASKKANDYGSILNEQYAPKSPFTHGPRRRLNICAIGLALVVPYGIFAAVISALCLSLHFQQPGLTWLVVAAGFVVVLYFVGLTVSTYSKRVHYPHHEPMWYLFCFVTSLLLWIAAVIAGCALYYAHFEKYFDVSHLGTYTGISPSRSHGQELMDASSVVFESGTHVDVDHSMSFRDVVSYCVAPITVGDEPLAAYDFWAVGEDCCGPEAGDFRCGAFNDLNAQGGLRVFNDKKQAMYRLAVEQAQARYHIQANHPLFFAWVHDPVAQTNGYWAAGMRAYVLCMTFAFAFQAVSVALAVIIFAKTIGHMVFNIYPGP